jgi:hypothetical protein
MKTEEKKDSSKNKKVEVDPQSTNKKIAELLLKFNKEMFKEKDGGGSFEPKRKS